MEFDVRYDEENDCLIGSFTGRLNPHTVQPYAKEIKRMASKHNCNQFLNDIRKAEIGFSAVSIYRFPGILNAAGIDHSWRRAIVASKQFDDLYFFEDVARNQGYQVKVFVDLEEVMKWLTLAGCRRNRFSRKNAPL